MWNPAAFATLRPLKMPNNLVSMLVVKPHNSMNPVIQLPYSSRSKLQNLEAPGFLKELLSVWILMSCIGGEEDSIWLRLKLLLYLKERLKSRLLFIANTYFEYNSVQVTYETSVGQSDKNSVLQYDTVRWNTNYLMKF